MYVESACFTIKKRWRNQHRFCGHIDLFEQQPKVSVPFQVNQTSREVKLVGCPVRMQSWLKLWNSIKYQNKTLGKRLDLETWTWNLESCKCQIPLNWWQSCHSKYWITAVEMLYTTHFWWNWGWLIKSWCSPLPTVEYMLIHWQSIVISSPFDATIACIPNVGALLIFTWWFVPLSKWVSSPQLYVN